MKPSIVLYRPEIPPNTGNIARLCVAIEASLSIVGKTPLRWDDASLRRAGLDHWEYLDFSYYPRFKDYYLAKVLERGTNAKSNDSASADGAAADDLANNTNQNKKTPTDTRPRLVAITKEGENNLWDFDFCLNDRLIFGSETRGLPPRLLALADARVGIPMWGPVRSLNLSNAVAITVYRYLEQMVANGEAKPGAGQSYQTPEKYRRGYYRSRSLQNGKPAKMTADSPNGQNNKTNHV